MKALALSAAVACLAFVLAGCSADSTSPAARTRPAWSSLPAAPVKIDAGLTTVWTGKELLVSGVRMGLNGTFIGSKDVAAAYNPATGWRRIASPPKTASYCNRNAAWTGREMLVWGCGQLAYDPAANAWHRLPQAPTGEGIAIWTGRELIGWGGGCCGDAWDGGSAFDLALAARPVAAADRRVDWPPPDPCGQRDPGRRRQARAELAGARRRLRPGDERLAPAVDAAAERAPLGQFGDLGRA
jgi:hypothetical protein